MGDEVGRSVEVGVIVGEDDGTKVVVGCILGDNDGWYDGDFVGD